MTKVDGLVASPSAAKAAVGIELGEVATSGSTAVGQAAITQFHNTAAIGSHKGAGGGIKDFATNAAVASNRHPRFANNGPSHISHHIAAAHSNGVVDAINHRIGKVDAVVASTSITKSAHSTNRHKTTISHRSPISPRTIPQSHHARTRRSHRRASSAIKHLATNAAVGSNSHPGLVNNSPRRIVHHAVVHKREVDVISKNRDKVHQLTTRTSIGKTSASSVNPNKTGISRSTAISRIAIPQSHHTRAIAGDASAIRTIKHLISHRATAGDVDVGFDDVGIHSRRGTA